jgi:hypothetical protein
MFCYPVQAMHPGRRQARASAGQSLQGHCRCVPTAWARCCAAAAAATSWKCAGQRPTISVACRAWESPQEATEPALTQLGEGCHAIRAWRQRTRVFLSGHQHRAATGPSAASVAVAAAPVAVSGGCVATSGVPSSPGPPQTGAPGVKNVTGMAIEDAEILQQLMTEITRLKPELSLSTAGTAPQPR